MPERITDADLARWEELATRALQERLQWTWTDPWPFTPSELRLIPESRAALPALVAEVRRLRKALDVLTSKE